MTGMGTSSTANMDLNGTEKRSHINGTSDTGSLGPHAGLRYDGATMIHRVWVAGFRGWIGRPGDSHSAALTF